jgi:MBG domain (YGX type)
VTETSTGAPVSATVTAPGPNYAIIPSAATGSGLGNYTISYVNGTLTVNPAPLTITANNDSKPFGTVKTFSPTAFTEIGLVTVNGDTITGVTETSTGAPAPAPVGTYPIVPSAATGNRLGNYTITYVNGTLTVNQSIIVLDPTAGGALSLSGNASIALAGGVFVDSSSSTALSASGNAQVKASVIDVVGKVQESGNASLSPAPTTGAASLSDPLASIAEPSTSGLTNYGSESLSGNSSATINPGIYTGITISGNAKLTLSSGIYIIEGGGFSVSGNASVSGSGVMIFNAGSKYPSTGGTYGSISLSGNGSYSLSAATSGTYAGILIFQPKDNTSALSISGNFSGMTGAIYAPAAQLNESGNGQLNATIDVDSMTVSGNGIEDILLHVAHPGVAGGTVTTQELGISNSPAAIPTPSSSSTSLMALDLALADAGTTTEGTASGVTPMAARRSIPQTAGKGSTLNVVTTPRPTAIDPVAVDALLIEGLSFRTRGIAYRPGQPMKWSL